MRRVTTQKLLTEILNAYRDTGLTLEEMHALAEQIRRIKAIFGDSVTIPKIIEFLVDFHLAQAAVDKVGADEPLTNEAVLKWQELKERDTAKEAIITGYNRSIGCKVGECPKCGTMARDYMNFCNDCGQRLKWEE